MAILFEDCTFNFGGVKCVYLLTKLTTNKPYPYYPLDYFVASGDSSIITDINEYAYFEKINVSEGTVIGEERQSDKLGKYFEQTIEMNIPKVLISTSQFLNTFLFKRNLVDSSSNVRPINIDAYNTTVIFYDNNNQWWIGGYDAPFKITKFETSINNRNDYTIELKSTSYSRIRKIDSYWSCAYNAIQFG